VSVPNKRRKTITLEDMKTIRITGDEARKILVYFEEFVEILGFDSDQRTRSVEASSAFAFLWNIIREPCDQSGREKKAAQVRELAVSFVQKFRLATSNADVVWYMHTVVHHLPDFIRRLPCDISHCSGQGIEQLNQVVKRAMTRTNHHTTLAKSRRKFTGKFVQVGQNVKCREYLLRVTRFRLTRHMRRVEKDQKRQSSPIKQSYSGVKIENILRDLDVDVDDVAMGVSSDREQIDTEYFDETGDTQVPLATSQSLTAVSTENQQEKEQGISESCESDMGESGSSPATKKLKRTRKTRAKKTASRKNW
jgi:hypothetical protein